MTAVTARHDDYALKTIAPAVPYVALAVGLLILHSAWAAILGYHSGAILVVVLSKPALKANLLFRNRNYRIAIIATLVGASAGLILFLLWPLLSVPRDFGPYIESVGLTSTTWPVFLAYYVLVNPLIEEYYWRGYLGSNARRVTANDFLFSGFHLITLAGKMDLVWLAVMFLSLSMTAWLWRQFDRLGRGLLPSTASHTAADLGTILVIYWAAVS